MAIDLEAITLRRAAATEAPWCGWPGDMAIRFEHQPTYEDVQWVLLGIEQYIPALVAEVERLQAQTELLMGQMAADGAEIERLRQIEAAARKKIGNYSIPV